MELHSPSGVWIRASFRSKPGFSYFRLLFEMAIPLVLAAETENKAALLADAVTILKELCSVGSGCLADCMKDITVQYNNLVEIPMMERFIGTAVGISIPMVPTAKGREVMNLRKSFGSWGERFEDLGYARLMRFWLRSDETMHGIVYFSDACEGPPGFVHGGCVASVLDVACAVVVRKAAVMTSELTVSYKRPVPLLSVLLFEGRITPGGGDNLFTSEVSLMTHYGEIKATARAQFARPKAKGDSVTTIKARL